MHYLLSFITIFLFIIFQMFISKILGIFTKSQIINGLLGFEPIQDEYALSNKIISD